MKIPGPATSAAALGALLGLGSPAGLFLLRCLSGDVHITAASLSREITGMGAVYAYTLTGTVLAFSLFGFLLGRANQLLKERLTALEKLGREMERLSVTDGLTGVFVRRHLMARLEALLAEARSNGRPLACLFVDVDNLKLINDRHGHRRGDQALTLVAASLQRHLRENDVLGRYGGDEFVAILPGADIAQARACAERIRDEVQTLSLPADDGPCPLSVSVGVHSTRDLPPSADAFLKFADDALRLSKARGRNRVETSA